MENRLKPFANYKGNKTKTQEIFKRTESKKKMVPENGSCCDIDKLSIGDDGSVSSDDPCMRIDAKLGRKISLNSDSSHLEDEECDQMQDTPMKFPRTVIIENKRESEDSGGSGGNMKSDKATISSSKKRMKPRAR